MSAPAVVTIKPAALALQDFAKYLGLSASLVQQLQNEDPEFPQPRQVSARRIVYLTSEGDVWLSSRPRSQCLPPKNSGYGRGGKPAGLVRSAA